MDFILRSKNIELIEPTPEYVEAYNACYETRVTASGKLIAPFNKSITKYLGGPSRLCYMASVPLTLVPVYCNVFELLFDDIVYNPEGSYPAPPDDNRLAMRVLSEHGIFTNPFPLNSYNVLCELMEDPNLIHAFPEVPFVDGEYIRFGPHFLTRYELKFYYDDELNKVDLQLSDYHQIEYYRQRLDVRVAASYGPLEMWFGSRFLGEWDGHPIPTRDRALASLMQAANPGERVLVRGEMATIEDRVYRAGREVPQELWYQIPFIELSALFWAKQERMTLYRLRGVVVIYLNKSFIAPSNADSQVYEACARGCVKKLVADGYFCLEELPSSHTEIKLIRALVDRESVAIPIISKPDYDICALLPSTYQKNGYIISYKNKTYWVNRTGSLCTEASVLAAPSEKLIGTCTYRIGSLVLNEPQKVELRECEGYVSDEIAEQTPDTVAFLMRYNIIPTPINESQSRTIFDIQRAHPKRAPSSRKYSVVKYSDLECSTEAFSGTVVMESNMLVFVVDNITKLNYLLKRVYCFDARNLTAYAYLLPSAFTFVARHWGYEWAKNRCWCPEFGAENLARVFLTEQIRAATQFVCGARLDYSDDLGTRVAMLLDKRVAVISGAPRTGKLTLALVAGAVALSLGIERMATCIYSRKIFINKSYIRSFLPKINFTHLRESTAGWNIFIDFRKKDRGTFPDGHYVYIEPLGMCDPIRIFSRLRDARVPECAHCLTSNSQRRRLIVAKNCNIGAEVEMLAYLSLLGYFIEMGPGEPIEMTVGLDESLLSVDSESGKRHVSEQRLNFIAQEKQAIVPFKFARIEQETVNLGAPFFTISGFVAFLARCATFRPKINLHLIYRQEIYAVQSCIDDARIIDKIYGISGSWEQAYVYPSLAVKAIRNKAALICGKVAPFATE